MPRVARPSLLIEAARADLAAAFGADGADIVFTSGATEAAALALAGRGIGCAGVEHDAVTSWCAVDLPVDGSGSVTLRYPEASALQLANPETGVMQDLPDGLFATDATQAFGKVPVAFNWLGAGMAMISAHKIGGPKGVGALVLRQGLEVEARIRGGGQEMGRRSGTENVIGIAGFGAAAKAAARDLADGVWDGVAELRDLLEAAVADAAPEHYLCRAGRATFAQHELHCHPRLEGRDAGDADGSCRIRDFGGLGLFVRQGQAQPGVAGDGI